MTTAAAAKRRISTAAADILPECIVDKIVSYLSFRDAAKMSILSKTWLQAYHSHPNVTLGFDFDRSIASADKIMERYRDTKIPIHRFELSSNLFSSTQVDNWFDIALQNDVKELALTYFGSCYCTEYTYPIVKFLAAAKSSLRELVLMSCDNSLSTCLVGIKLDSLRTLSLITLTIIDIALQSLLSSCPLIVNLTLDNCTSLDKIDLRKLQKIRSLTIMRRTYRQVKIQAPTLEHLKFSSFSQLEGLDMVDCPNLRSLEISCNLISDPGGLLELLIFRSQFLESLILVCHGTCLGSFNHCRSQSLRVLTLGNWEIIGEIDAPNLVSLTYKGSLPIPQFKFAKESSQLKHSSKIILDCGYDLDAAQFCRLRTLLANCRNSLSQVTLSIVHYSEINKRDLQLHDTVDYPQVDVLNVDIGWSKGCPTFVDALLWSCHPRRLNLLSSVNIIRCFISRLMHLKNLSNSTHCGSKHWLSQLKDVKAYKFDEKNQSVELKSEELAFRTLLGREKVYFLLDW